MTDLARAFADRYAATEASLDADRIVDELYCPDGVLDVQGGSIVGRDALRDFYRDFLAPVERVQLTVGRVAGCGDQVAFEWRSVAVMKDGERVEASGCDFVTLRDGKVARNTPYATA